ncbi:MAG: hypothetical protein AAGA03_19580 [Planctomycetota bacterium]
MSAFNDALSATFDTVMDVAGEAVVYQRGQQTVELVAVRGETEFEELASDGEAHVQVKSIDWLIRPQDLQLDEVATEPSRGDRIVVDGEQYDLMPGSSNQHWRWSDSRRTFYRIHTVRRGNVPSE